MTNGCSEGLVGSSYIALAHKMTQGILVTTSTISATNLGVRSDSEAPSVVGSVKAS